MNYCRFHTIISERGLSPAGQTMLSKVDLNSLKMKPSEIGDAACHVLAKADSGSIWAITQHGDKPFLVKNLATMENVLENKKK